MNKKGGYQIIDLKNFNFISSQENLAPITLYTFKNNDEANKFFKNILFGKNTKTLLFTNIVINGVEKNDVYFNWNYKNNEGTDTDYYFNIYNYICELWVNENNVVFSFNLKL